MDKIRFYGLSADEFHSCKTKLNDYNKQNIKNSLPLLFFIEILAFVTATYISEITKYQGLFVVYFCVSVLLAFLLHYKNFSMTFQMYLFMGMVYSMGIFISAISISEKAFVFPIVILLLPILFIDDMLRSGLFTVIVSLLFIHFNMTVKDPDIYVVDTYNIVMCCIVSIVVQYFTNKKTMGGFLALVKYENLIHDYEEMSGDLRLKSRLDLMTGLYNRNYFFQKSPTFFEYSTTIRDDCYLVMMDLDKFKRINDTYGHQKGDEIIIRVADVLKSYVHDDEFACRLGGDEYIFVLSQRFHEDAIEQVIDNILKEIHKIYLGKDYYVSGSIGITRVTKGMTNIEEIYQMTDEAMYESKSNGGNQMTFAKQNN